MKTIVLAMAVLISCSVYAQNDTVFIKYDSVKHDDNLTYMTDTIIFGNPNDRQILYGTTVLPLTQNQQVAKGFGLYLEKVSKTDCTEGSQPRGDNEVVSVSATDTTLNLELKVFGNCCHSFLCDVEVLVDSIINLTYHGYGAMYCDCTCCFGLTYNFSTIKGKYSEYGKLRAVMINGNRKSIKRIK